MGKDVQWFKESLNHNEPPEGVSSYLLALWHDGKGDWKASHDIAQDLGDQNGSRIHAYLHRKEGDLSNANYWYHRAGRQMPDISLSEEWQSLVTTFLDH